MKQNPGHIMEDDWKIELCPHCKTERAYNEEYDAYYCPKCMYWLEHICSDRDCEYCKDRPKYPIDLSKVNDKAWYDITFAVNRRRVRVVSQTENSLKVCSDYRLDGRELWKPIYSNIPKRGVIKITEVKDVKDTGKKLNK
jgi:hypothetical protein